MKLPTDHIFRIVHAMTASEKRYFKRHYASETSLLTTLFEFINGMKEYDEDLVKTHFSKTKLSKNLKVYKVQLADLILKSLVSYYSKNNVHSKIRVGLEEIDVLIRKQLFDIATSKVRRLKTLCLNYEVYEYLFPILSVELSLNSFYSADSGKVQHDTFAELYDSISTIQEVLSLQKFSHQLSDIKNHLSSQALDDAQHKAYTELLDNLLQKLGGSSETEISFREQYYQLHVISMIYRLVLNDPEKEHHYKSEQIALLKNKEKISSTYPSLYFASMHNYLSSCWKLRRLDALESGIEDIQIFINNNSSLEPNKLFVYYLQILLLFGRDIQQLTPAFEKEVLAQIKKYKQDEDYLANLIYLRLAIIHLSTNNHKRVQFFLRRINQNTATLNSKFGAFVIVLELVSHYHSGDLFLVERMITSQLRKRKKPSDNPSELFEKIISFFQKLYKIKDQGKVSQLAATLLKEAKRMKEDPLYGWLKEYAFFDWLEMLSKGKNSLLDFLKK
ncbi:MAG: hypothetical protein AB8F74_17610 [Saprospiraceae bacterium]